MDPYRGQLQLNIHQQYVYLPIQPDEISQNSKDLKLTKTVEQKNSDEISQIEKKYPKLYDGLTLKKQNELKEILTKAPSLVDKMPELVNHLDRSMEALNALSKFSPEALAKIEIHALTLFSNMDTGEKTQLLVELLNAPHEKVPELIEVLCKLIDHKVKPQNRYIIISTLVLASQEVFTAFSKFAHKLTDISGSKKADVIKILAQTPPENWESLISKLIEKEFYTKVPNKRKKYGLVNDSPPVKDFLKDQNVPKELTTMLSSYLENNQVYFEEENITMPEVIQPTVKLIKKIADYYLKKYKIKIIVCRETKLKNKLKDINGNKPFGVIVINSNVPEDGHVTPILHDFTRSQVFSLDVVGYEFFTIQPGRTIKNVCNELNLRLFNPEVVVRQADIISCRIDAPVILRNALLHIKSKGKDPIFLIKKHYNSSNFGMPINWNYTDQITPKILKESSSQQNETLVTRGIKKETVSDFRKRHTKEVIIKYSLTLEKKEIPNLPNLLDLNLPSHVTVVEQQDSNNILISWTAKRTINTYIVEKGWKYAKKSSL